MFADLHLHLLPGLDDGPRTLADSLAHADRLDRHGIHEAVVTPHLGHPAFDVRAEEIAERTERLQRALTVAGIDLRLRPGAEIHASAVDRLEPDELELVAHGPPGARWVLLEAPFGGIGSAFVHSCRRLHALGFGVLVAHPERSDGTLDAVRRLLAEGALLQVNACSLMGRHGDGARARALRLVLDGSAAVIASDGHGGRRDHTLRAGLHHAIAAGAAVSRAAQLTQATPRFLLEHGIPALSLAAARSA